jgi:hypothetical protein
MDYSMLRAMMMKRRTFLVIKKPHSEGSNKKLMLQHTGFLISSYDKNRLLCFGKREQLS